MMEGGRLSWNARPLRALEAVARLGSVSAAAAELGYTQSAASQQLAALERATGLTLVDRGARPLRLTEAGATVLRHARGVLAGFVAMESALAELHGLTAGRVRIVAFASAMATFLPPAVAELGRRHPGLVVDLAVAEPAEAIAALRAGAADLAMLHRTAPPDPDEGLRRRFLRSDPLRLVAPAGHPLARRGGGVPLAELAGVPLVAPRRDRPARAHRALVESLLASAGVAPEVAYEVDDLPAAQALARAGLAAALMHELTIPPERAGLAVLPLADAGAGARAVEAATLAGRRWPAADAMVALLTELAPAG